MINEGKLASDLKDEAELKEALDKGYQPVFWISKE
jgi:hypothetical protein